MMTVGELKKALEEYPDDLLIGFNYIEPGDNFIVDDQRRFGCIWITQGENEL